MRTGGNKRRAPCSVPDTPAHLPSVLPPFFPRCSLPRLPMHSAFPCGLFRVWPISNETTPEPAFPECFGPTSLGKYSLAPEVPVRGATSVFLPSAPAALAPWLRPPPVPDVPVRALGDPSPSLPPAPVDPPVAVSPLGPTVPPLRLLFPPVLIPAGLSSAYVPLGAPSAHRPPVPPHLALPPTAVAASLAAAALPSW